MPLFNPRLLRIGVAFVFLAMSAALAAQTLPEPVSRDGVILGRVTRTALEAQGARP